MTLSVKRRQAPLVAGSGMNQRNGKDQVLPDLGKEGG